MRLANSVYRIAESSMFIIRELQVTSHRALDGRYWMLD